MSNRTPASRTERSPEHKAPAPRILFLSAFDAPFIREDLEFLDKRFRVRPVIGSGMYQGVRILIGCLHNDVVFCWFASVYASWAVFLMSVFRRRSIIVVGGVDVAKETDLGYGIWLSPWKSLCVRYALRHASAVLPVDANLAENAKTLAGYDGHNITVLPTGYDASFWKPGGEKHQTILAVASVKTDAQIRVKGVDVLIEAAGLLKNHSFVVIGMDRSQAAQLNPPSNVRFVPRMPREDLLPYYQAAHVYCQPSRREGLSNALCEAMLCECIPVASAVGGNPAAVGAVGILVPPADPGLLAGALLKALALSSEHGRAARARISEMFPRDKRRAALMRLFSSSSSPE